MNMYADPETLDQLMTQICRLMYKRGRKRFRAMNLHRGQPPMLQAIHQREGQTHSALAEQLRIAPATATKMLQRLEQTGFVARRPDPKDQRVSRVYLTPDGVEIQEKIREMLEEFNQTTFKGLDEREKKLLWELLLQVKGNLLQALENEDD